MVSNDMRHFTKGLASAFVLTVFLSIWFPVGSVPFGTAQTGTNVIGILNSDTTWTQSGSPYTLTGPTAVNQGVTLTIQPGVAVNLGGFYIQVNGTLSAVGTSGSRIQFSGGTLRFTPVGNGWNDNAASGCTIQYADLSGTTISASVALKLSQDTISGGLTLGDSSVIDSCNIASAVTAGNNAKFTNNQLRKRGFSWFKPHIHEQ